MPLSKIESRKRNGNYQIFEIEREISLSTLDFSLESETIVNAWSRSLPNGKWLNEIIYVKVLTSEEEEVVDG